MNNIPRRRFLRLGTTLVASASVLRRLALAAQWPARALNIIVPYAPGGQGDVVARLIGTPLAVRLGQPVVVENRPGASGALGVRAFLRTGADDHRFLMGQTGEIAINGITMQTPGYDTRQDLRAVAMVANAPLVLAVPYASPFTRLRDLLNAAAQQPGRFSYASSGTATPGHLAAAKLATDAGLDMTHIPYKGAGAAITDLIGGQVDCFFASASSVLPHIQGGRLRALAVSTTARVSVLDNVPPVADTFAGFNFSLWAGLFAQRSCPDVVVEQLATHINTLISEPALRQRIEDLGSAVKPMTPAECDAFVHSEILRYTHMIRGVDAHAVTR